MTRHCIALLMAILVAAASVTAPCRAEPSPEAARLAKFYAEGLERPLYTLRRGDRMLRHCATPSSDDCSPAQRQGAEGHFRSDDLDLFTLLPAPSSPDKIGRDTIYLDFQGSLKLVSDEVLYQSREFDILLFARYSATLRVCPPPDVAEFRQSLAVMQNVAFLVFDPLTKAEFKEVVATMVKEDLALAEEIRRDWTPKECAAARDLGETLLHHMYNKLEPWMPEGDKPTGSDAARGAASEFLFNVAYELEMLVNPAVRARILERNHKGAAPAAKSN